MPDFKIEYEIWQPASRNQRTGNFKYTNSGYVNTGLTVTADDETDARKKAAKHPKLLKDKDFVNKRIGFDVQDAGGKARHKIKSIKRISGRGGGAMLDLGRMATGTDLPPMKKMNNGGAVMANRGTKFKGVR